MKRVECIDRDGTINEYLTMGYRVDMVMPADSPREVQLSKNGEIVRLVTSGESTPLTPPSPENQNNWTLGRAGMMYRDMMPDRMDGRMAVSHIRLTEGGPVPDYVHYHKIEFQMIRCIAGRIKVVYEDQGAPFWLEPGDWVIQPPEIRHRVLECEAGSEVIEISVPAEHETWAEHEMTLPTAEYRPDRNFGGQRFVHYMASRDHS
jgi:quercetin dioxygenase-like cupin family protein